MAAHRDLLVHTHTHTHTLTVAAFTLSLLWLHTAECESCNDQWVCWEKLFFVPAKATRCCIIDLTDKVVPPPLWL